MPPGFDAVLPELLVGEYPRVEDLAWLRDTHGVDRRASASRTTPTSPASACAPPTSRAACARSASSSSACRSPTATREGLAARLPPRRRGSTPSSPRGGRVYLHCNAGYNRAPTVAIAYLHVHRGLALDAACALVKERRSCVPYVSALRACYA